MLAFTLRYRATPDDAEIGAVESLARAQNARVAWQRNGAGDPVYALVEGADASLAGALAARQSATVVESPVIALAVYPERPEALPPLRQALGGPGAPAGIVCCEPLRDGLLVEWNLDVTGAEVVLGLIDVEFARHRSARRTELLSPIPLAWWTRIAAAGLSAPEIAPDRVLEALLEEAHVAG